MVVREKIRFVWLIAFLGLALLKFRVADSFWLTEMNLFEPRPVLSLMQSQLTTEVNSSSLPSTTSTVPSTLNPSLSQQLSTTAQETNQNQLLHANVIDDLPNLIQRQREQSIKTGSDYQAAINGAFGPNNQCSCDSSWLRNETSQWLNKWLNTTEATHQLRLALLMSNSTGARLDQIRSTIISNPPGSQHQSNSNPTGGNHPRHSAVARRKSAPAHFWASRSRLSTNLIGNFSHWSAKSAALSPSLHSRNNNNNRNLVPMQSNSHHTSTPTTTPKTGNSASNGQVVTQIGAQGPKGDQGPRGERGEPRIASVKDRDALFQLEQQQDKQSIVGKLVFVESEQFLVLGTSSGWRPFVLASLPLRDFRQSSTNSDQLLDATKHRVWLKQIKQGEMRTKQTSTITSIPTLSSSQQPSSAIDAFKFKQLTKSHRADSDSASAAKSRNGPNWRLDSNDINLIINEDDPSNHNSYEDENGHEGGNGSNNDGEEDDDDDEDSDDDDDDDDANDDDDDDIDDDDEDEADSLSTNDANDDDVTNLGGDYTGANRVVSTGDDKSRTTSSRHRSRVKWRDGSGGENPIKTAWPSTTTTTTSLTSTLAPQTTLASNLKQNLVSRRLAHSAPDSYQFESQHQLKLRMVALNEPYSGNQHGIRGADFECRRQAARANIKGSFRSFLSSGGQNLADLVRPSVAHKNPIVNLRGEQLASSWTALLRQPSRLTNPLSRVYSFDGRHVATDSNWPNKLVWHGAQNKHGLRHPTNNCDSWHSDGLNKFGTATPVHNPRMVVQQLNHCQDCAKSTSSTKKARRFLIGRSDESVLATTGHTQIDNNMNVSQIASHNHSHSSRMFLELVDKFPCRMPLVVLCIETVARGAENSIDSRDDQSSNLIQHNN